MVYLLLTWSNLFRIPILSLDVLIFEKLSIWQLECIILFFYTEELPQGADCDFEVDLCGWHNVQHGDELEWIRHKNSTPTLNTGPSFDHTKGNGSGKM